ncbi:GGDEF domain-containing protein [Sphingomonas sp. M1-B02]|uniref:GGDEF domain-containing protein n=1 Tax=Sphingomonas sp. M1-B02 TaxID=3114300 RepID=UPI0022400912|nr:diguanylate cyclase [Sphingomonas sp. S6-11]UZK67222.1 diguanylate cyclase [Sphingomonas sp. S6-11]
MPALAPSLNDDLASRKRHVFGFASLVALLLMLIVTTGLSHYTSQQRRAATDWQMHTLEVLLVTEKFRSSINESLRGERGYLITGDPRFLDAYDRGVRNAPVAAEELLALTRDRPAARTQLMNLLPRLNRYLAVIERTVNLYRAGRRAEAVGMVQSGIGRRHIETLLAMTAQLENEERRLLAEREAAGARAAFIADVASLAMSAVALLFLLIVAWAGYTASRARQQALELAQQLRLAATIDELTGLLNRRAFLAALDTEIARVSRSGAPLAIALVDLDYFKKVNDNFGHHAGDQVLRRFAEIAREKMRAADMLGRIGGEEFAVLMPDTDKVESGIAGERLREGIARRHIVLETGVLVPITVSVGVAHYIPGETRDQLIIRADEALYEAKHSGRNRTRLAA